MTFYVQVYNMLETKKIVTIAVVIVVVVAAIGVALLVMNNDKSRVEIDAQLEVFGNANNDDKIDQSDIDLIQQIIDGEKAFEDYPLADANNDGVIDQKDIEQVKAIMNASSTNKIQIWHINHFNNQSIPVQTLYPITSAVATGAANTILMFKYLGIVDEVKGFSWAGAPDGNLFQEYMHLITADQRLGTSATRMDVDKVSNLVTKDHVTAAITADNRTYLANEEATLEAMNVDVVRVTPAAVDSKDYMSTVLLLAFLFDTDGKGYMNKCAELTSWYEDFLSDLNNKLRNVKNKASAVTSSSDTGVSTASSDYTDVLLAAGASFPLYDRDSTSATESYIGGESVWLNKYDVDYVIPLRTSTTAFSWYGGNALTDGKETLTKYINNFRTLECYEKNNVFVVSGDMPVMMRIAYIAQTLYTDVFGEDYADNYHKDFVKKFFGWDANMIDGKSFVASMEDLGIAQ